MEIGNSINLVENEFRDLIEQLLKRKHGEGWLDHLRVPTERVKVWEERRDTEPKRRSGVEVEHRPLYYADFYDVVNIIRKHWNEGFKDCFKDRKRFDTYTDRLNEFRNPDAHSRNLVPFEEQLVLGMTGELRQEIALFLSTGAGGPEPEYFARIEEGHDNFGLATTGFAAGGVKAKSSVTLHPGDVVSFVGRAWDPEGSQLEWLLFNGLDLITRLAGDEIRWEWNVAEGHISEEMDLVFMVHSTRSYHRHQFGDDQARFTYRVLPRRS